MQRNGIWPATVGIYERCMAHILKISDLLLCSSILEMGINPCIGQEKLGYPNFSICIFLPEVLSKLAIISVICPYADSVALGIVFKC